MTLTHKKFAPVSSCFLTFGLSQSGIIESFCRFVSCTRCSSFSLSHESNGSSFPLPEQTVINLSSEVFFSIPVSFFLVPHFFLCVIILFLFLLLFVIVFICRSGRDEAIFEMYVLFFFTLCFAHRALENSHLSFGQWPMNGGNQTELLSSYCP